MKKSQQHTPRHWAHQAEMAQRRLRQKERNAAGAQPLRDLGLTRRESSWRLKDRLFNMGMPVDKVKEALTRIFPDLVR